MTGPVRDGERDYRSSPGLLAVLVVCIGAPIVALMLVGTYARDTPRLGGIPFFYWYQFLWVFIAPALTWMAYRIVTGPRGKGTAGSAAAADADADDEPTDGEQEDRS